MKRRHLLAGAAALPLAGIGVDVQALNLVGNPNQVDPVVAAVHRWFAAEDAERRYHYEVDNVPDDNPLGDEERRCWQAMIDTSPQTATGLALMLAAFLYRIEAVAAGSHFHDPDSWYFEGAEGQGTAYRMLRTIWWSPAATELLRDVPARDPADYLSERERAAEAYNKALVEAQKRPYEPTGYEVHGAMVASEAAGKPISEDEAIALLREHGRRKTA